MKSKSMQKGDALHGFSTGAQLRISEVVYVASPMHFPVFQKPVSFTRDFACQTPQQSKAAGEGTVWKQRHTGSRTPV